MKQLVVTACLMATVRFTDLSLAAAPGLVAHYTFDEGSGLVLRDSSGKGNHGKILGAAWRRSGAEAALDFDSGDYVDCGDYPSLRPKGPLTLSVWVRTISAAQQDLIAYHAGWTVFLAAGGSLLLETWLREAWDYLGAKSPIPLNEWTFIAIVYDPEREVQEVLINGELSNSKPRTERPWKAGQHFRSKVRLGGRGFAGLMDEVRIYLTALSASEIKKLYEASPVDRTLEPSQYRFAVKPHLFPREGKITAEISLNGPRIPSSGKPTPLGPVNAVATLCEAGKKRSVQQQTLVNLAALKKAEATFSLARLKPGDYEIRATAKHPDGRLFASESAWVTVPRKPWWFDSKAGLEDRVLPPYTPLRVRNAQPGARNQSGTRARSEIENQESGMVVECWGRAYEFSSGPFPQQIVTAGRAILSEPIQFLAQVDGSDIAWVGQSVRLQKKSATRVVLTHEVSESALQLVARTEIECDGMIRIDCKVAPLRPCTLQRLSLKIPLRREHATLQYQLRDALYMAPGLVPEGGLVRSFNPAIWLGDEERGLQWFCESDQYWFNADPNRVIEIVREGESVLLRLHLVSTPVELVPKSGAPSPNPQPLELKESTTPPHLSYTFGLQATPLKPIAKDAWDYRINSAHRYGADYAMLADQIAGKPVLDYYAEQGVRTIFLLNWTDVLSYPGCLGHADELRRLVKAIHQHGMQALLYLGAQFSELAPEFDAFKEDFLVWESGAPGSHVGYHDNYPGQATQMTYGPCIRSDWQDFVVAGAARLMDEFDVDGFYLDGVGIGGRCHNVHHGCGYIRPDGSIGATYSFVAGRNAIRRLYQIVKHRKPRGQLNLHPAAYLLAPTLAWATSYWDGETILNETLRGSNPKQGTFLLDVVRLDLFRAEYLGRPWGVPAEYIHYYMPTPFKDQLALALLHDVPIRPHLEGFEFQASLWRLLDRFGRRDAEWLPYWKNSQYVAVRPEGAYVSLYRHPRNGLLVVVANLSRSVADVTVLLDLARLKSENAASATDALEGQTIAMTDGRFEIRLPSLGWRIVWIKA